MENDADNSQLTATEETENLKFDFNPNFKSLHNRDYCSSSKFLPAHRMPQVFNTQGTVGILLHEAVENMIKCFARDPQYDDEPPLDFINPMARTLPEM